jgi:hypothetical protein
MPNRPSGTGTAQLLSMYRKTKKQGLVTRSCLFSGPIGRDAKAVAGLRGLARSKRDTALADKLDDPFGLETIRSDRATIAISLQSGRPSGY